MDFGPILTTPHYTLAGGGVRCDIEGGSNPAWCGRAALSPRRATPGSSHLDLAASAATDSRSYHKLVILLRAVLLDTLKFKTL